MREIANNPRIEFTTLFNKQRKAAPLSIKIAFRDALELFLEDPHNLQLRNHRLTKELSRFRSIDVTGDWRAIFSEIQRGNQKVITFHRIGTHEDLYGKS